MCHAVFQTNSSNFCCLNIIIEYIRQRNVYNTGNNFKNVKIKMSFGLLNYYRTFCRCFFNKYIYTVLTSSELNKDIIIYRIK